MKKRNILTESDLRTARARHAMEEIHVAPGTFVTPLAREYMRDHGIRLVEDAYQPMSHAVQTGHGFIDCATGEQLAQKGEYMTHLHRRMLVPKNHPRIVLRGMLDSLQAEILLMQADAGSARLQSDLGEILEAVRQVLGAEVKDTPLPETTLLGMDQEALHRMSHEVKETFGFDHPVPSAGMDLRALRLNRLRTEIRAAERSAVTAFPPGTAQERADIIRQLNRLSSAVYLLFCRVLAGYYKEDCHGSAATV